MYSEGIRAWIPEIQALEMKKIWKVTIWFKKSRIYNTIYHNIIWFGKLCYDMIWKVMIQCDFGSYDTIWYNLRFVKLCYNKIWELTVQYDTF